MNYNDYKKLEFSSKTNYSLISFALLWLFIFAAKWQFFYDNLIKFEYKSTTYSMVIYAVTIYFIYQLAWSLFGKSTFEIQGNTLIVKTGVSVMKTQKRFDIRKIHNAKIKNDVPSGPSSISF